VFDATRRALGLDSQQCKKEDSGLRHVWCLRCRSVGVDADGREGIERSPLSGACADCVE
jgi:hypothetical protein